MKLNTRSAAFAETGYCLFPNVLNADEIAARQHALDVATRAGFCKQPSYYGEPHTTEVLWLETCTHPKLLDAVESVLGPNLILVYSSMFIKVPHDDQTVCWHQDNTYWESVHGTDVVTVWLAIDDVDKDNAPMQVIPGSHIGYQQMETHKAGEKEFLSAKVDVTPEQEASAVSLTMKAGSLSIHDSHLIHGGGMNTSDRRRAGYTIRFCSTDTAWVDLETHPIPVYLVRGERGSRGDGYVDLRP
jgi:ectoine hydroxylase-related dioxygenase (phytanoyl-CoA dioxygenase family)